MNNGKSVNRWLEDMLDTFADMGKDIVKAGGEALESLRNFIDGVIGGRK